MNVLVIGGTRYMGRIMVQELLDQGDHVTVFSRGNTRPDWWDQVEHVQGDRNDREDFNSKLKGKSFDAVVDTQAYRTEDVVSAVETRSRATLAATCSSALARSTWTGISIFSPTARSKRPT